MLLWRLSGKAHAEALDGGYGLSFEGRWNNVGHPVTYCATSPSLCVLEKLVHIEDPGLVPDLIMVTYDVPDVLGLDTIGFDRLPESWRHRDSWSQQVGSEWLRAATKPLLGVPSAIVPLVGSPDWNVLINHRHPASTSIAIRALTPFALDLRLL